MLLAGGDGFELLEVVEVVAGYGFDHGLEGHFAAFGMGERFREHLGGCGADQREIPIADGGEDGEGRASFERRIIFRPLVLVEGLDDVMVFREGLAQAKPKDHFAIGEVAEDLAGGPFSWGEGLFRAFGAQFIEEAVEAPSRSCDYFLWIAIS